MMQKTPFGTLTVSPEDDRNRVGAVLRALFWCESLLETAGWTPCVNETSVSLQRTMNGQTVEIFPLEAARMDLGRSSRFSREHLPITLNGKDACVRCIPVEPRPLHTDMVASMILLLGRDDLFAAAIPRTLHPILTSEQLATLPRRQRRERTAPGQPSTSGREFLPEEQVLALLDAHPSMTFEVQFEMRSGRLRNMTARDVNEESEDEMPRISGAGMAYNPADYHLKTVVDQALRQFRNIAVDRVTMLSIGGHLHRTDSAEDEEE